MPPTQLGTSLGTTLGTALGSSFGAVTLPKLYGVRGFSAGDHYATAAGGGEAGVATGFGAAVLLRLDTLPSATSLCYAARSNNSSNGWLLYSPGAQPIPLFIFYAVSGAGVFVQTPSDFLRVSDLGRIFLLVGQHEQTNLKLFNRRTQIINNTNLNTAITGFTSSAGADAIGAVPGGTVPATNATILGRLAWRGIATQAQIEALSDAARAQGDVPASVAGLTFTHRWSARDQLRANGGVIVDRQGAPVQLTDTVTAAPADAMARTGNTTLVVSEIDPAIDGRKTYGLIGFGGQNNYVTAAGAGPRGSVSGFWQAWCGVITGGAYNAACKLLGSYAGPRGTSISSINANLAGIAMHIADDTGALQSTTPTLTLDAADIGRPILIFGQYNPVAGQTELYRYTTGGALALIGTKAVTGYAPANASDAFGVQQGDGASALTMNITFLGAAAGDGHVLTSGERDQLCRDFERLGRMPTVPGKTTWHADPTQDIAPAPDSAAPAQLLDRAGTGHLARVGTGLQVSPRTERLFSYEATPVNFGGRVFSAADYWSHPTAMRGSASGFTVACYWGLDSINVSSAVRSLLGCFQQPSTFAGWLAYFQGSNTTLSFGIASGAGALVTAPNVTLTVSDVGKKFLSVFTWDGSRVRQYLRRVESGSGSAATGYTPSTNPLTVGIDARGGANTSPLTDGVTVYGWGYSASAWSLVEVQAAHDRVIAADDIQAVPGKTDLLVSLTRDAQENGGAFDAQALDRIGGAHFTKQGNPTLRASHSRAMGW